MSCSKYSWGRRAWRSLLISTILFSNCLTSTHYSPTLPCINIMHSYTVLHRHTTLTHCPASAYYTPALSYIDTLLSRSVLHEHTALLHCRTPKHYSHTLSCINVLHSYTVLHWQTNHLPDIVLCFTKLKHRTRVRIKVSMRMNQG